MNTIKEQAFSILWCVIYSDLDLIFTFDTQLQFFQDTLTLSRQQQAEVYRKNSDFKKSPKKIDGMRKQTNKKKVIIIGTEWQKKQARRKW